MSTNTENCTTMEFVGKISCIALAAGLTAFSIGFAPVGAVVSIIGFGGITFRLMAKSKYDKIFKALKLGAEDEYPYKVGSRETEGGTEYAFTTPAGLSLEDFQNSHDAIEQYIHHRIKISSHNGYIFITELNERC